MSFDKYRSATVGDSTSPGDYGVRRDAPAWRPIAPPVPTRDWQYYMSMCAMTPLNEGDFIALLNHLDDVPAEHVLGVVATVSPGIAGRLLAEKVPNRNIRNAAKARLADDMGSGRWQVNGQPIILDARGRLVDGQHRCTACVSSGVSFDAVVIVGVSQEAAKTIDTGTKRTNADVLSMNGMEYAVRIAAAVAHQYRYERGHISWSMNESASPLEQDVILAKHPGLVDSVRFVSGHTFLKKITPLSIAAFVHYHAAAYDAEKANRFFAQLDTGEGLTAKDPVLHLRNRLMQMKASKGTYRVPEILAIYIKAWNASVAGRPISVLRWSNGGEHPEEFPVFVSK